MIALIFFTISTTYKLRRRTHSKSWGTNSFVSDFFFFFCILANCLTCQCLLINSHGIFLMRAKVFEPHKCFTTLSWNMNFYFDEWGNSRRGLITYMLFPRYWSATCVSLLIRKRLNKLSWAENVMLVTIWEN